MRVSRVLYCLSAYRSAAWLLSLQVNNVVWYGGHWWQVMVHPLPSEPSGPKG